MKLNTIEGHDEQCVGDDYRYTPIARIPVGATTILAKLEYLHGTTASIKDRVVKPMIDSALKSGAIATGGTVVDATSGSTGIAAAVECSRRGLSFVTVVPDTVPPEKLRLIELMGGRIVKVAASSGMMAARRAAQTMAESNRGWWHMNQFANGEHINAHHATAAEIVAQVGKAADSMSFCAGVGTGATLTGIYDYCSLQHIDIQPVVARVDPGAERFKDFGFTPVGFDNLFEQRCLHDSMFRNRVKEVTVSESEAEAALRFLWRHGFPVGPASAVNFAAAYQTSLCSFGDATTVTIFTDRVERYIGTTLKTFSS
jgi:cysteine synthase A